MIGGGGVGVGADGFHQALLLSGDPANGRPSPSPSTTTFEALRCTDPGTDTDLPPPSRVGWDSFAHTVIRRCLFVCLFVSVGSRPGIIYCEVWPWHSYPSIRFPLALSTFTTRLPAL